MASWKEIEENIHLTKIFLKNNLAASPFHQNDQMKCSDCILRYISILVISGKIRIKKIMTNNHSFWSSNTDNLLTTSSKSHGAEWHNSMIKEVDEYFSSKNYLTQKEPNLYYGRADLGISDLNLYIEVGTINFYKLLNNLMNLKNCRIIIIPDDDYLLEISL